jgi:hypothetical protein
MDDKTVQKITKKNSVRETYRREEMRNQLQENEFLCPRGCIALHVSCRPHSIRSEIIITTPKPDKTSQVTKRSWSRVQVPRQSEIRFFVFFDVDSRYSTVVEREGHSAAPLENQTYPILPLPPLPSLSLRLHH